MSTPLLFVDVDGVINATPGNNGLPRKVAGNYVRTDVTAAGSTWPIWYDPRVIDAVNGLSRDGLFEVVWLTTWEQYARTALAPALGLDDWPALNIPGNVGASRSVPFLSPTLGRPWWKTAAVKDLTADGRPYAWIDDELHRSIKNELRAVRPAPSLLITTFPAVGMTLEHVEQLAGFAREAASVTA